MTDFQTIAELLSSDHDWYTPAEVGRLFRVDPKTVIRWGNTGKLDKLDVQMIKTPGGHRRYKKEDIDRVYQELNPQVKTTNDSDSGTDPIGVSEVD